MNEPEQYFDYLIGKRVIVIWENPRHDWIAFKLLWEDCGNVKLQGMNAPDGSKHDGSSVICKVSEIRQMIEWKPEQ